MARKLGWLLLLCLLALRASAANLAASISGVVTNSAGVPQMGAAVEMLDSTAIPAALAFTDANGRYSLSQLAAGLYRIQVSAPSFLPSTGENVSLRAGANLVLNVTLNTLTEAVQAMPIRRRGPDDDDGWKWNLRNMANRPLLRVLDDDAALATASKKKETNPERALKTSIAFLAGSEAEGYGGTGDTAFSMEKPLFTASTLAFNGNVNYGAGSPAAFLRASYSQRHADGSESNITVIGQRFATPGLGMRNAALQALSVALAESFNLADFIDLRAGTELQAVQFMDMVSALRPFGEADIHLGPNTVLRYSYASSRPNLRAAKGFDWAPPDLSESSPRVALNNWSLTVEHSQHHELSLSQRIGSNAFQLALYRDIVSNPALTGVGITPEGGNYLPDVYTGTFNYLGRSFDTTGMRFVAQRKLASDLTATIDYSYGGVLEGGAPFGWDWSDTPAAMRAVRAHSVAAKMAGMIPGCGTHWIASYRWTSTNALTPVDWFNVSPGMAEPYLAVFVRQPIPGTGFLPGHMEAMVDIRNLLAQGYIPVVGQDGRTLYLVQAARSVRGGLAFTF